MSSIEEIIKYCNDVICDHRPIPLNRKEQIRQRLIDICRNCKDINCITNKDCLVKKAYNVLHDD